MSCTAPGGATSFVMFSVTPPGAMAPQFNALAEGINTNSVHEEKVMAARIKKLSLMSLVTSFLFTATTLRAQDRDAMVLFIRQFSGNTTVAWPFDPRLL